MPAHTLTVSVPENLFKHIRTRAKVSKRSLEAEVLNLLTEAISDEDVLPPNIATAIAGISALDDRALLKAVKPIITTKQTKRLAELNYKAQDEGLTEAEKIEQRELLQIADTSMVVRAAVLAELHKRGVDVSEYTAP